MIYNNNTYRNLQNQVWYLTNYLENEAQLVELGIRVVGAQEALPIPEGTYEYGDAFMIGTAAPYDMYIWTRKDESHAEDYWFAAGKFPLPGPAGPSGNGAETFTSIDTGSSQYATYDRTDGINATYDAIINYKDSTTGEQKSKTVSLYAKTPILPGQYISIDNHDSRNVEVKVDDTALSLDFYKVAKPSDGSTSIPAWDGTKIVYLPYAKDEKVGYPNALVKTSATGEITINRINFAQRMGGASSVFQFGDNTYYIQHFFQDNVIKDISVNTSSTDRGTVSGAILDTLSKCKSVNVLYRGFIHVRQSPISTTGIIKYISTECGENTITVRNFVLNAQSGAWTWEEKTFPTVSYYTHRVVIYDGGENAYYTITLTNSRADAYANLGDNLTSLFNDIGIAGVMAYKNAPDGQYVPVLLTRDATSESAIHWQTGTQTGTIEQSNIADIQDHITPAITNN